MFFFLILLKTHSYIDYEITLGEVKRARGLYERLLEETAHVKVWLSYVRFEEDVRSGAIETRVVGQEGEGSGGGGGGERAGAGDRDTNPTRVRSLFERGYGSIKEDGDGESRALMLREWLTYERSLGVLASTEEIHALEGRQPKVIKRRRLVNEVVGESSGWEEYYDYLFPEDQKKETGNLKILQIAQKWKAKQAAAAAATKEAAAAAAAATAATAAKEAAAAAKDAAEAGVGAEEEGASKKRGVENVVVEKEEEEEEPVAKKQKVEK